MQLRRIQKHENSGAWHKDSIFKKEKLLTTYEMQVVDLEHRFPNCGSRPQLGSICLGSSDNLPGVALFILIGCVQCLFSINLVLK